MSATGRSNVRLPDDAYETPEWCTRAILCSGALPKWEGRRHWLDPCAGNGAIIRAAQTYHHDEQIDLPGETPRWLAVEKRCACRTGLKELRLVDPTVRFWIKDFFKFRPKPRVSVVLTNPPFSLAMEFIVGCMKRFSTAWLCFLLRLNFLGSRARSKFFHKHMPDVYVLSKRPSFTGGGTDATEYAWMIWHGNEVRRRGSVEVLGSGEMEHDEGGQMPRPGRPPGDLVLHCRDGTEVISASWGPRS